MSALAFILLYGVSYGLILCIIAVGLVVTMGLMRVVNLTHGAFAAIGGYLAVALYQEADWPLAAAVLAAVAVVAVLGFVAERLFFRHLYTASELDQVLLTIGLSFIVVGVLTLGFGPNVYPIRLPSWLAGNIDLGFRDFEVYRAAVIAICVAVIAALWLAVERTNVGAQLRAAVENRSMAQASGINVPRLFSITFTGGSALAALGGAIGAPMLPLEPLYPFKYLVLVLVIVALSGYGNIRASIGVSILVGIVETAARYLLPQYGAFALYVVLIVLIVWRREGLFTRRRTA